MLTCGPYPAALKARIASRLGHLDNRTSGEILAALDRSRLRHVIAAHLSQTNNTPDLARAALAEVLHCEPRWISVATQEDGFDWRELLGLPPRWCRGPPPEPQIPHPRRL